MSERTYEIRVCPVCGEQPYRSDPDMFGEIDCGTHGTVEPLVVQVVATTVTTVPAWRVRLPDGSHRWQTEEPTLERSVVDRANLAKTHSPAPDSPSRREAM